MNWDWDKLQEKRQRQQGQNPPPRPPQDQDHDETERDEPRARRTPFNKRGSGPDANPLKRLSQMRVPNGRAVLLVLLAVVGLWLLSGIYIINPDEQGVVLRFGKYERTEGPGPHYAWPVPIETVYKPQVTQVLRSEVGFRSVGQSATFQQGQVRTIPEEASMLTGDENIVNVQFSVQYKISDPVQYLFNVSAPAALVRNAAEAAMREVIGNSQIDSAITDGKLKIQSEATQLLQQILNRYGAGIHVIAVQLQDVHPPQDVIEAFKDVASAREDKSRIINEAEAYRNELLPKARGQAAAMRNQAEAYSATRVRNAEGDASRFDALRVEYEKAPKVTKQRLYYETMEDILAGAGEKVLMDGAAAARAFAAAGYQVAVLYHQNAAAAAALEQQLPGCIAIQCDVASRASCELAFHAVEQAMGRVDVLVCNAGIAQQKLFTDITPEEWQRMLDVNLSGAFHLCQLALPGMIRRKQGRILTVSSMWGQTGGSCEVHYSAAKAGLIGLTKALAKEEGPSGITVNCVAPGVIETDMMAAFTAEDKAALAEETPVGRLGTPEEVAKLLVFLAGEDAGYITGQVFGVNGGLVI